jgi:hypothetical protein
MRPSRGKLRDLRSATSALRPPLCDLRSATSALLPPLPYIWVYGTREGDLQNYCYFN